MHELIALAEDRGLVLAADLTRLGVSPRDVRQAVTDGRLVKVARGVYGRPQQNRPLHPRELHSVRVRGVCARHPREAVVSHLSAAALHGLPLIGPWPDRVHLTVPGSTSGSASPGIFRHSPAIAPNEVIVDGVRVTSLARTLVDVAATSSMLIGVTMVDAALFAGFITKEALVDELERSGIRAGARRASASIEFGDARAASPGESLTRVRTWQLGFEMPQLQVGVDTAIGHFDVDFGWESCALFGEFDGAVKYTREQFRAGRTVEQVVVDEKIREDAIRAETGRRFLRIVWAEALDATVLGAKLGSAGVPRRGRDSRHRVG